MTKLLNKIAEILRQNAISSPRLEARRILSFICQKSEDEVSLEDRELSLEESKKLDEIISQRLSHKPLDKILGTKGFYKYDFIVSEDVLSPRPDTEILVEEAIRLLSSDKAQTIIDFGTGSGCILLSLLAESKMWRGQGVDVSVKALKIAKQNASLLGLEKQVAWVNKSWFDEDLAQVLDSPVDMIVSNPPYIPSKDIAQLEDDVKLYDPIQALDGGEDGLEHYRQIAKVSVSLLKDGGYILLEVGIYQAQAVAEIFCQAGLQLVNIVSDLGQIARCVILKK